MTRYSNDPRYIDVRYPAKCAKCGNEIRVGERAFYYPESRSLYGSHCEHAEEAAADFASHAQDEDFYNS